MIYESEFKKIIGEEIIDVTLSDDRQSLKMETKNKFITFEVTADCCSESWILIFLEINLKNISMIEVLM